MFLSDTGLFGHHTRGQGSVMHPNASGILRDTDIDSSSSEQTDPKQDRTGYRKETSTPCAPCRLVCPPLKNEYSLVDDSTR